MGTSTRKRRAATDRKHEPADRNETVRLKEELQEAKRLLDEAHECMVSECSGLTI